MSGDDLALIAEKVSPSVAQALVRAFGGTQIYLPQDPAPEHKLTRALGLEDARAICRVLGPGHLDVPLGAGDDLRSRGRRILDKLDAGHTPSRIAREEGCTERTVRRWRRRQRDWRSHG